MPGATRIEDIDWERWTPTDRATLVFVISHGQVLLIRKKRGLGAGKITGPGGGIEPGESPADCARRELEEELEVRPLGLEPCGANLVQFLDGQRLQFYVFRASGCDGSPVETVEAVPIWTPLDRIPYHETWEDDRLWLPLVINGTRFLGRFVFDGDAMLDQHLEQGASATAVCREAMRP
ncbi:MAG: NUDIX domain-containing protein [Myxococcota bacterium]|nr:NUDIX domain-containing protein [Myxococcota bacterium]